MQQSITEHGNSKYTEELANKIVELIANDWTLREICSQDGWDIKPSTIIGWMHRNEDFANRCARARETQAHALDDKMAEVCRKVEDNAMTPDVARVIISNMQWRASKKAPKHYGENKEVRTILADGLTKEQRDAAVAAAFSADR